MTKKAASRVKLFDTTLRDGTQGEGISVSVEDKLKIAKVLDQLGVHYIEGVRNQERSQPRRADPGR